MTRSARPQHVGPGTSRRRDERIPAPERREAVIVAVGREKFAHAVPDADRGYAGIVNGGPCTCPSSNCRRRIDQWSCGSPSTVSDGDSIQAST